ncbi:DUF6165 family protein [uncultured Albimonas sp.]|uniref:DUF6165 family protein n=1 Tax=uncultured Albimonas sp. TaxID=1331701 RepID=UPI0030EDAB28|tara:strand:+ start:3491 stop:3907 length:417 start_codon:yes stop_codon:yes gene_type:complete
MTAPSPRIGETAVLVEVSPGELIDKITILEIKAQRLSDPSRRFNVTTELELLVAARDASLPAPAELDELTDALRAVNEDLWSVEDDLRACESRHDFGPGFVALARSVYRLNDRRAALKREINLLLHSRLMEEKSHPLY